MPYPRRRAALRDLLCAEHPELDALLVTDLVNVRYLTGFTGSQAALLLHVQGDAVSRLGTDGRYRTQVGHEVPDLPVLIERASARALVERAGGLRAIGFESDTVTVDALATLQEAAPAIAFTRAPGLAARLRQVKDATEVAALRVACGAGDAALAELLAAGGLRPGRTEREVALDLENRMRVHGATGPAFATIVAAGPHSAVPHHQPTDVPLRRGDLVTMDFGALVEGYHSDMTRTVVLGPAADWQRELYALVAAAQAAGRAALVAGTGCAAVDAAARSVIEQAGRGPDFVHPLGHGVGLQIHEAPLLAATTGSAVAAGMVITVEPGVYLEGRGGVRIEDTLLVGGDAAQPLTRTTRDLLEVG
jgi:Xaa-Pro aminopeptidase